MHMGNDHVGMMIYDVGNPGSRRHIPMNRAPGMNGSARDYVWSPRFVDLGDRFFTVSGPHPYMMTMNPPGKRPGDVYMGRFNDAFTTVEAWVRVTSTPDVIETLPHARLGDPEDPPQPPRIVAQPEDVSASEGQTVRFSLAVEGAPPPAFQWQRNGADIPGATAASYQVTVSNADCGARFRCVATNARGRTISREAKIVVQLSDAARAQLEQWDAKLLTRMRDSLKAGTRPALSPEARHNRREVVSIDARGTLKVEMSMGMQVGMPLEKLSPEEKASLAVSVVRQKSAADHCLAAFYLLAAGREEDAAEHLGKGGAGADSVRAAFGTPAVPAASAADQGGVAGAILALTGGRRTRIVWIRSVAGKGHPFGPTLGAAGEGWRLMVFDTSEGAERALIPKTCTCHGPRITPSGDRVVWTEYDPCAVYVADWDGANARRICEADREILAVGTAEDPPGTEWAYVGEGQYRNHSFAEVWRYPIDGTAARELVWNRTASNDKWAISRDGKRGASGFPWPSVAVVRLPNGPLEFIGQGCVPGLAPDDSGRAWHMLGNHKGICVYDRGGSNRREVDLSSGPGLGGHEVWSPTWAKYDARFFTVTGPHPGMGVNPSSGNVYLGRFDEGVTRVAGWAKVSDSPGVETHAEAFIGEPVAVRPAAGRAEVARAGGAGGAGGPAAAPEPKIAVTSPSAGEVWTAGSRAVIRWTTENLDNVVIWYSLDGGTTLDLVTTETIFDKDPRWGAFPWMVPETPSDRCVILVVGYFGEAPARTGVFTIAPRRGRDAR